MAEADWIEQILERPAIMCSQGGVPYNDFHLKEKDAMIASLRAQLAEARAQERERLLAAVPSNWCDPLLTGPDAVLSQKRYSYSPTDIERLLNAIRDRIRALSPTPHQEKTE